MADIRIAPETLESFTASVFEQVGLQPEDAATEAHVLVWANLRGIDSHGVLRIPQYVASVERGGMNPHAEIRVLRETPATLLIEADHAFGPVVTTRAMQQVLAEFPPEVQAMIAQAATISGKAYWGIMQNGAAVLYADVCQNNPNVLESY